MAGAVSNGACGVRLELRLDTIRFDDVTIRPLANSQPQA